MQEVSDHPKNCPFCRPGLPGTAFMESEDFLALYNLSPVLPGHSLVIPRRHIASLMELTDAELAGFSVFSRRVTRFLTRVYKGNGFDWSVQEGETAGQSVNHLHMHIVIRKPHDLSAGVEWYPLVRENELSLLDVGQRKRLDESEYIQVTEMLKREAGKEI